MVQDHFYIDLEDPQLSLSLKLERPNIAKMKFYSHDTAFG